MGKRLANGTALHTLSRTNAAILAGEEDLRSWTDEEIHRGQKKDKNGRWVGRPPRVIPQEVHVERVRRTMTKAHELLRESTYKAVALLETIVEDTDATYPVRMQAAQMILERTLPKTSEKVTVHLGNEPEPFFKRLALTAIKPMEIVPGSLADDPTIIDAEIVFEDDDTEWHQE